VGWGGCEMFCIGEKGVDWGCLGNCVKVTSMSTSAMSVSGLHFDMYNVILVTIIYGPSLKCYGIVHTVLHIWVLLFTISSASLYLMC